MADEAAPAPVAAPAPEVVEPAEAPAAVPVVASAVPAGMLTPSGISTPGTGTVTPALSELPPDQVENSLKISLADLCAKAAVLYSQQKNYEEASEVYARAAEMQAEMNGEMNPENAEILFLYGRALFKVGQGKSDVLGGKAPETNAGSSAPKDKKAAAGPSGGDGIIAAATKKGPKESEVTKEEAAALDAKKPLFQFTGDEEWDEDSDDEVEAEGDEGEKEEEEDDLAVAFEVLDLSRVLFERQLEVKKKPEADSDDATTAAKGKEPETKDDAEVTAEQGSEEVGSKLSADVRHIMERLADTHDLLAEISLENERYPNAIVDSRASLSYKKQFLPEESEIIAEAHFKLSLALEFASVTTSNEGGEGAGADAPKDQQVDQELRDEAASELELAIASTKLKLQNKEVELATLHSPEDNDTTRRQIAEVKDIISDMEQRLLDLRKPPIDLNEAVNGPAGAVVGGLLGAAFGAASGSGSDATAAKVEEAKKGAKDLSGLVRKKVKDVRAAPSAPAPVTVPVVESAPAATETATPTSPSSATNGNGNKRKADEPAEGEEDEAKKAKTAEAVEAA